LIDPDPAVPAEKPGTAVSMGNDVKRNIEGPPIYAPAPPAFMTALKDPSVPTREITADPPVIKPAGVATEPPGGV
jgi:hypothetical protein